MRNTFFCTLCDRPRAQLYHGWPVCNRCKYELAAPLVSQSAVVLTRDDLLRAVERGTITRETALELGAKETIR